MNNVIVIQETTPDLIFDVKPFNYVNSFDMFVYAYSSSYSLRIRKETVCGNIHRPNGNT
jgi:hypothetical protein